ncbi:MAG TPA: hypothetical protein VFQ77_09405 [Pseudonocardiaceae bacterium]|nr:hypothetical protein [Pseudonocardiaceae bacterium]
MSLLYLGMVSLDGLAYTAPALPNGGQSTAVLAAATASVAEVLGRLTSALGAAGENVEASIRTLREADTTATRYLTKIEPF